MTIKSALKELVNIIPGMSISSNQFDPQGNIPVILASGILADQKLFNFSKFKKIKDLPVRSPAIVNNQDILIVSRATIGTAFKSCIIETSKPLVASSSVFILRLTSNKILPEYLNHYLNSHVFQKEIQSQAKGSTISHITKDALGQILIPTPALTKQKIIIDLKANIARQNVLHLRQQQLKEQAMQATFLNL